MKNMIIAVGAVVVLVATFVGGAWYGAVAGQLELAKYEASITTYKLRYLDDGQEEALRSMLEDELYTHLLHHTESRRLPYSLWWTPGLPKEAGTDSLVHASSYWVDNNLTASFEDMFASFQEDGVLPRFHGHFG